MPLASQLVRARAATGLSQDDLANSLGVSRTMVSYWEAGKRSPNDRQLAAISQLLRVPIGVLLGYEEPAPAPDLASMLLRGAGLEVPDEALSGLADFVAFLDTFAALGREVNYQFREMRQSPYASGAGFESSEDARRKAEEVRSYLRLGMGPVGDLEAACDLLGITVYKANLGRDLKRTVSGAFLKHHDIGFSILVNLDMTRGRRRFTLAHELAHALFHSDDNPYLVSTATKTPRERFADNFAGEFLMPVEGIRRIMEDHGFGPRIEDPAEVIQVQRFFGVSYITALVRLRQARYLNPAQFDQFKLVRPVLLARALGYDIADEEYAPQPDSWRLERFPQRFRTLVRLVVRKGIISVPTVAALTRLSIDEVADLVREEAPKLDQGTEELEELREFEDTGIVGVA